MNATDLFSVAVANARAEFGAGRGSDTKGAAARNSRPTCDCGHTVNNCHCCAVAPHGPWRDLAAVRASVERGA